MTSLYELPEFALKRTGQTFQRQAEYFAPKAMVKLQVKPLSANDTWRGRRFKTNNYKQYEQFVLAILPKNLVIPEGNLQIEYVFGFSNIASDIDNPIKAFQDILCKKYNFNDKRIFGITVKKIMVPKKQEFIEFRITQFI